MDLVLFAIMIVVVSATFGFLVFLSYRSEKHNYQMYQKEPLDADTSMIAAELGLDKTEVYASIKKWQRNLKKREE